jgi:hypothetical protein
MLEKHFNLDIDYKNLAPQLGGAVSNNEKWGGHNKQTILLTIKCFKWRDKKYVW